jgi:hypothetical protein
MIRKEGEGYLPSVVPVEVERQFNRLIFPEIPVLI